MTASNVIPIGKSSLDKLTETAYREFDGQFTIMKLGSNWRVCLGPKDREGTARTAVGTTLDEALAGLEAQRPKPAGYDELQAEWDKAW
jgi:hypothetical protein